MKIPINLWMKKFTSLLSHLISLTSSFSLRLSSSIDVIRHRKSVDISETWQWTPATLMGAVGVLAGAAALYLSVVKEDVIRPPPAADATVIIKGIKMAGKQLTP